MRSRRILFITWDGPQTQYLGRLFLPVFEHLASAGYRITILQFSSAGPELRRRIQSQCVESGVQYVPVPIIKRLGIFGVILALVRGSAWLTLRLTQRDFDIVIVRSIVPALVFLVTQGKRRVPLVYDSDGLPIEQRLEFEGVQERGILHRFLLLVERLTLRRATAVVSRSRFGTDTLRSRVKGNASQKLFLEHNNGVGVISSPDALERPSEIDATNRRHFSVAYVGSWGSQYCPEEMLELVVALRERIPSTVFSIFSGDVEAVESDLKSHGLVNADWVKVKKQKFDELHEALQEQDLGLALRSSSVTAKAVYPLKVADYLFAGLPVVGNVVADMESELVDSGVFLDITGRGLQEVVNWCEAVWRDEHDDFRDARVLLAQQLYRLDKTADVYRSAFEHAESYF